MAKHAGEPTHGTYCVRCNRITKWHEKKRIATYEHPEEHVAIKQREKIIDSINLCNTCYREYVNMMYAFIRTGQEVHNET